MVYCVNSHKLQTPSIKATLVGIQFHLHCLDPSAPSLFKAPAICLLLNGIAKTSPPSKDKRLPITLPILHNMLHQLRRGIFKQYTNTLLGTVFTAFYWFLRCREFAGKSLLFNPTLEITTADITMYRNHFSLFLKHSKTDKFNKGSHIVLFRINSAFCPFSPMSWFLKTRRNTAPHGPLFLTADRKPMTSTWFSSKLQQLCCLCGQTQNSTLLTLTESARQPQPLNTKV